VCALEAERGSNGEEVQFQSFARWTFKGGHVSPIHSNFRRMVPHGKRQDCFAFLEEGLRSIRQTPYHAIVGQTYLHHVVDAARYIADSHRAASEKFPVAVMYFEMNGFSINPDRWYFDGFAYRTGGDIWDLTFHADWLSGWDAATDASFNLTGLEKVQKAFESLFGTDPPQPLSPELAAEITEHLVVARFDELIAAATAAARQLRPELMGVPVFSTAHERDALYAIE